MNYWFRRIISASLSPNTRAEDGWTALRVLCTPWTWKHGTSVEAAANWFQYQYGIHDVVFFQSGRVALYEILKSLSIGEGDEVLVQAFTCVAVPNSVLWVRAKPVYVDIDESLNMDPEDIAKKITPRTKALIVQHTLGTPADMKAIMGIAKKHKLLVIEDCAHAIGATYDGKKLGTLGDAAFFSFGRDKAVSSVWGGAATVNGSFRERTAGKLLKRASQTLPQPGYFWIFQQVLHPIAFTVILPLYNSGIGKALLLSLQRVGLLSKPVAPVELHGGVPDGCMTQYPNGLAQLLIVQLRKLPEMIRIRKESAEYYAKHLPTSLVRTQRKIGASYLRYAVLADEPLDYRKRAKKHGVLLGNWYHNVIDPKHTDMPAVGYVAGSCPRAESVASRILNLPTLLSDTDRATVVEIVR